MEGASKAGGVTPQGIRAGDPAALQGLIERRGPAVMGFATLVCGPENAPQAAAEALARFRAAVRDSPDLSAIDPEMLLRAATRHASAALARIPSGPPPRGRLRSRGTQTCRHVPVMLAARANGALGQADLDRLARHLDRCERCAALGETFRRAEDAYADPPFDALDAETEAILMAGLQSVDQEVPSEPAPPPVPGELPTQITGPIPALSDLDDETRIEEDEEPEASDEPERTEVPQPAAAAATGSGRPARIDEERTGRVGAALRFALPIFVVLAIAAIVVVNTGMLADEEPEPTVAEAVPSPVEPPVTTPLPVTVGAEPAEPTAEESDADPASEPRQDGTDAATPGAAGDVSQPAQPESGQAPPQAVEPGSADATGTTP